MIATTGTLGPSALRFVAAGAGSKSWSSPTKDNNSGPGQPPNSVCVRYRRSFLGRLIHDIPYFCISVFPYFRVLASIQFEAGCFRPPLSFSRCRRLAPWREDSATERMNASPDVRVGHEPCFLQSHGGVPSLGSAYGSSGIGHPRAGIGLVGGSMRTEQVVPQKRSRPRTPKGLARFKLWGYRKLGAVSPRAIVEVDVDPIPSCLPLLPCPASPTPLVDVTPQLFRDLKPYEVEARKVAKSYFRGHANSEFGLTGGRSVFTILRKVVFTPGRAHDNIRP